MIREENLSSRVKRMMVAISLAVVLGSSALHAQTNNCEGARFAQIMSSITTISICAIFGPIACTGYAVIVVTYDYIIWVESGC